MKRSTSSINNNRDVYSSQSKRIRSSLPVRQEEDLVDQATNSSIVSASQKKVLKVIPQNIEKEHFDDDINRNNNSNVTTSTPSRSSISFSSTSSKGPSSLKYPSTSSSSSKNIPSSINYNKKADRKINTPKQVQEKVLHETPRTVKASSLSRNNPVKKVLNKENRRSDLSTVSTIDTFDESEDSYSKVTPSLSHNKNQIANIQNSKRSAAVKDLFVLAQTSSSSSLDAANSSETTAFPINSLVEGSLEYREMKRMYLREKQQGEDWRKDYKVLKRQLAQVKSTTIPRPTAEVLEWLHELLDLMNNNGVFRGDGRGLKRIVEDLSLDETSAITIAARTPQKSALKIFRLLYPTTGSRAKLGTITKVPTQQLDNIYLYVRTLHKNLSFTQTDMRKAIGTSIRSATCALRKIERYRQQQTIGFPNDENVDPDDSDEMMVAASEMEIVLDGIDNITDDDEDEDEDLVEDEDKDPMEDEDEDVVEDAVEDEDDDEDKEKSLMVDEELDEDDD